MASVYMYFFCFFMGVIVHPVPSQILLYILLYVYNQVDPSTGDKNISCLHHSQFDL